MVARGTCHCIFVYDIAFAIDLTQAERQIKSAVRETIKHKRRAPRYDSSLADDDALCARQWIPWRLAQRSWSARERR